MSPLTQVAGLLLFCDRAAGYPVKQRLAFTFKNLRADVTHQPFISRGPGYYTSQSEVKHPRKSSNVDAVLGFTSPLI